MFNTSMLVVVRTEDNEAFEELRKLVEAEDDNGGEIVGTEDGSVRVIKCLESDWNLHQKAGRESMLADKFMFIDVKKGIVKPDNKFDKYGISYGYEGNTLLLSIDSNYVWTDEKYQQFLVELKEITRSEEDFKNQLEAVKESKKTTKKGLLLAAGSVLLPMVAIPGAIVGAKKVASIVTESNALRQQRLLYGIAQIYYNDLDKFIKGE